jgi:DNA-binding MarR family transcriptional regulator
MKQSESKSAKRPIFGNGLADELEFLFAEVHALGNCLRKSAWTIHGEDNLRVGALSVLQDLESFGPMTVPQLARARATSRQNVQVLVDCLESEGLVEYVANPAHKRSDLVELTRGGRDLLAGAIKREAAFLAGLLPHTTEAGVLATGALLHRLRTVLSGQAVGQVAVESPLREVKPVTPRKRRESAVEPKAAPRTATGVESPTAEADEEFPVALL